MYLEAVPDDTTLIRWAGFVGPDTLGRLNDRAVELARTLKVTRGRKLRTDGTVVEANVHHPTDSSLLANGVRVLSRLVGRAKASLGTVPRALFRDRTRSAKRLARGIAEGARRRGEEGVRAREGAYRKLLGIARASLGQAGKVREALGREGDEATEGLAGELAHLEGLVGTVVRQTERRVLGGEAVPAGEKLVSLFEPHAAIIRRGRAGKETEFGRRVPARGCWLDEVEGGIASGYRVLEGNAPDAQQLEPALSNHERVFGAPPGLVAADRGVYSAENEEEARRAGVERVCLPKPGRVSEERRGRERQGWFRRGMRYRAGVEGRISVLKRRGYLGRCRDKGEVGFERWVGWGVLTANLSTIARTVAPR